MHSAYKFFVFYAKKKLTKHGLRGWEGNSLTDRV